MVSFVCWPGLGFGPQTGVRAFLWRFIDVIKIHNQWTLREIILDQLGEPDLINWKAFGAELRLPWRTRGSTWGTRGRSSHLCGTAAVPPASWPALQPLNLPGKPPTIVWSSSLPRSLNMYLLLVLRLWLNPDRCRFWGLEMGAIETSTWECGRAFGIR